MARNVTQLNLVDGEMRPSAEIPLRIDQTLTQDATGTLVIFELEATGSHRCETEFSAQYVDQPTPGEP
jgi:aconitate hydratase